MLYYKDMRSEAHRASAGEEALQDEKRAVEERIARMLEEKGLTPVSRDFDRPWGGFFVLPDEELPKFLAEFYPEELATIDTTEQLSPKILVVAPRQRLSWQYHDRRSEYHRVVEGPVGYALNDTDDEVEPKEYGVGELIRISQGQRHRLIGLTDWGVVAEIWQHTDPEHPSDEADNHRVQDDYKRT